MLSTTIDMLRSLNFLGCLINLIVLLSIIGLVVISKDVPEKDLRRNEASESSKVRPIRNENVNDFGIGRPQENFEEQDPMSTHLRTKRRMHMM